MPTSPQKLTQALSRTPVADFDVAVIATTFEGRIGYWNREAERLYGWRASEVMGRNIVEVVPADAEIEQAQEIMEQLRNGRVWAGEIGLKRRGGSDFRAFVMDTPLPANDPELCAIIGASAPAEARDRVRERNALLRCELKRHLGDVWAIPDAPVDWPVAPANPVEAPLTYFRCYLLNAAGSIRAVRDGMFMDDEAALQFAREQLRELQVYKAAEVWALGRLVARIQH